MVAKLTYYRGRVQGVGFRWQTESLAREHPGVHGYVKNLEDGSVELWAEGPGTEVDAFLTDVRDRFVGYIAEVEVQESEEQGYVVFEIAR